MRNSSLAALTVLMAAAGPLSAQTVVSQAAAGALFERYSFDAGLPYTDVSELTVPVTLDLQLRGRASLTVAGGFARVSITGAEEAGVPDESVSGLLDTEVRLSAPLIRDRLTFIATGAIPTGMGSLDVQEQQLLAVITSEVLGFAASNLGTGGNVGGGLAGAVPAGRMALGFAGSYTHSLAYQPVIGSEREIKPGGEVRLRAGLEGSLGSRGYLRVAGIFAGRGKDQVDGEDSGEIGNRYSGYFSLDQGLGNTSLTLYAFDSYRSGPRVEPTALGSALLPKGNVFALGAQWTLTVAREIRLTPRAEYRSSQRAPDANTDALERVGSSVRLGADLRHSLGSGRDVVLEVTGLFGEVVDQGEGIGAKGLRVGFHLQGRR